MTPDDTNLSSAKLGALRATFRKYDISGNGRLGVQELMMVRRVAVHNLLCFPQLPVELAD